MAIGKPQGPVGFSDIFRRSVTPGTKGYVRNLVTFGDDESLLPYEVTFAFRPTPINEKIEPRYTKAQVAGNSSDFSTYANTASMAWRFEIYQNAMMMLREIGARRNQSDAVDVAARNSAKGFFNQESRTPPLARGVPEGAANDLNVISDMMEQDRRFFQSLCYPAKWGNSGLSESPPAVILCLPKIVTARCRLIEWDCSYEDTDINGNLRAWRAKVGFEEVPTGRITMEDVLENGCFRMWGNS